jgi:hypothetical protein
MKKFGAISIALALVALVSVSLNAQTTNPSNGHFYSVVQANITWSQARTAAESLEAGGPLCAGHLATVTSEAENTFIVDTFGPTVVNRKWLGGFQPSGSAEPANDWEWVTGESWDYTRWNPDTGEPNNTLYTPEGEDALAYWDNGNWNDAPTYWLYGPILGGYVVEYECYQVAIDIKPGSDPNCFNINGHGVIPVAVLGSDVLDVTEVDISTLIFGGFEARVRGNKGPLCSYEDTNGDGYTDLVCQFEDSDPSSWEPNSDSTATLSARLLDDGPAIKGIDSICVVP